MLEGLNVSVLDRPPSSAALCSRGGTQRRPAGRSQAMAVDVRTDMPVLILGMPGAAARTGLREDGNGSDLRLLTGRLVVEQTISLDDPSQVDGRR